MLKDLLAIVDTADKDQGFVHDAITFAEFHQAHLSIAVLSPIPTPDYAFAFGPPYLVLDEFVKRSAAKEERLAKLDRKYPVEIRKLSDEFGRLIDMVAVQARYHDLVLFGPADAYGSEELRRLAVEAVALRSGRPVLVLPSGFTPRWFDHVAVGWNATREAARALNDALPLVAPGARIDIIVVDAQPSAKAHGSQPGADIARHLARLGYAADVFDVSSDGAGVSATLTGLARTRSAVLLVIGAYGHSRLREMILGGVTRDLLEGAPVPVLLSH
jgi:nucleotide-binding universal stress UspA family protein